MRGTHCAAISGTRTARASGTMAADGFLAPVDYFAVPEKQGPLRVVRGGIQQREVNHENLLICSAQWKRPF